MIPGNGNLKVSATEPLVILRKWKPKGFRYRAMEKRTPPLLLRGEGEPADSAGYGAVQLEKLKIG